MSTIGFPLYTPDEKKNSSIPFPFRPFFFFIYLFIYFLSLSSFFSAHFSKFFGMFGSLEFRKSFILIISYSKILFRVKLKSIIFLIQILRTFHSDSRIIMIIKNSMNILEERHCDEKKRRKFFALNLKILFSVQPVKSRRYFPASGRVRVQVLLVPKKKRKKKGCDVS